MAKTSTKAKPVEIVETESPEVALALTDGGIISGFIGNLKQFFRDAREMETRAKDTLARAKALKPPTNGAEDAAIADLVRGANADRKVIDEHWTITSRVHQFHKRLVAARERGGAALDEAAQIGNRLHATYVENERRRAAEEEARLRREAEARARAEQDRQAAELEAAALKAENASPELSKREAEFLAFYTGEGRYQNNAALSAQAAGYRDPHAAGARLLATVKIQKAINAIENAAILRRQAEAVKSQPVIVEDVEVKPDVQAGGDRTTYSCEIVDPAAFRDAVFEGRHGIPRDTLVPDQKTLNELARNMREQINRWPGVRLKKNTSITGR